MEISEVRRRVRTAIERSRRDAVDRRERSDRAAREYEQFLAQRAVPAFHAVASALAAEGHRFRVDTPADSVRLSSDSSADDYIELALDTAADPPVVIGRSSRGRGRRIITSERPLREGTSIADLTDEHVVDFVASEVGPFVAR